MNDELLWNAIEGALGAEKAAYLRTAPLAEITGATDLPTAVAAHAGAHREKKAFWKSVGRGFRSFEKVATTSTPSSRPYPPNTSLIRKLAVAKKARLLEGVLEGDENVKVASVRREVDEDIFKTLIKQANVLSGAIKNPAARELSETLLSEGVAKKRDASELPEALLANDQDLDTAIKTSTARALSDMLLSGGKDLGQKALGAAALGTGAAVPLYIGGSALSDKATDDARNKALQTAAGVGGMALLGYGGKKLMDTAAQDHARDANYEAMLGHQRQTMLDQARMAQMHKRSSVNDTVYEKISALTATVYIDQFLDQVDQTEKVAALREVNRDYGVTLLCDLEESRTGEKTANIMQRIRNAIDPEELRQLTGDKMLDLTHSSRRVGDLHAQDKGLANKAFRGLDNLDISENDLNAIHQERRRLGPLLREGFDAERKAQLDLNKRTRALEQALNDRAIGAGALGGVAGAGLGAGGVLGAQALQDEPSRLDHLKSVFTG